MTPTQASTATAPRSAPTTSLPPKRSSRAAQRRWAAQRNGLAPLARYTDVCGRPREVIVRHALAGSILVVDRDAIAHDDCMLVAHLYADEPAENASVVCERYLRDVHTRRLRCRGVTPDDANTAPHVDEHLALGDLGWDRPPSDSAGRDYSLRRVDAGMSIPALRWCRIDRRSDALAWEVVSLRDVIAHVESYEPMRTLTARALGTAGAETSTTVLRAESARVQESPIILNRRLREVALSKLQERGMSMSELAICCGRIKRDSKGNESGETSWLARRLGLLAESGQPAPTPWIHSDVLALIARRGLGVTPREVEVP